MTSPNPTDGAEPRVPAFEVFSSRQFTSWLGDESASLAFTSFGSGRLVLVSVQQNGEILVTQRIFDRATGLWSDGQTLWLATGWQLWRFENVVAPGEDAGGADRVYVPQVGYTTGDVEARDLTVTDDGRAIFASALFDCLARPSLTHSFAPVWRPPGSGDLAPQGRYHLTGLALDGGQPAYATSAGRGDRDWRAQLAGGGVVWDVASGAIVASGLTLPRSPRVHRGRLWLINAGTGELGHVERDSGRFEPVAFLPGYPRGLAFLGDFAVVGTSLPRAGGFDALPLGEALRQKRAAARCGLSVIDLRSGDVVHWARIEGEISEVAEVAVLPGVRRPNAIGVRTDEIRRTLRVADWQAVRPPIQQEGAR